MPIEIHTIYAWWHITHLQDLSLSLLSLMETLDRINHTLLHGLVHLKMTKQEAKEVGPKEVVALVSTKVGWVIGARAPRQLPGGEMQATNAKWTLKFSEGHEDELFVMMQQAKTSDRFIRDIKAAPESAIVVASDQQLDDLVRFCGILRSPFSIH